MYLLLQPRDTDVHGACARGAGKCTNRKRQKRIKDMRHTFYPKRNIVLAVSEAIGIRQSDAEAAVNAVFEEIARGLAAGHKCELHHFGTFSVVERKSRPGRNPLKPQETCRIPARNSVKFKPAPRLLKAVAETKA